MNGKQAKQLRRAGLKKDPHRERIETNERITYCGCGKKIIISEDHPWRDCNQCILRKVNDRVKNSA